jgi:hypothetical protein
MTKNARPKFRFELRDGRYYELDDELYAELDRTFLYVDRHLELAALWCRTHPARRKTLRGIRAFLFRWLVKDAQRRVHERTGELITPAHEIRMTEAARAAIRQSLTIIAGGRKDRRAA